ncbi:uncharacterized protein ACJ7VT_016234 [Polymixia lowei]
MPATKVIKPKPVETTIKTIEKTKPVTAKSAIQPGAQPKVLTLRKHRASSCQRSPHSNTTQNTVTRRARSTSSAPKSIRIPSKATPACQKTTSTQKHAAVNSKAEVTTSTVQKEERTARPKVQCVIQSHKAFTVIAPNPKKRKEIQKKAEAELAALEELRLSRAMAYVSINPSSVGGCMSIEEVRLKQQEEMMQVRGRQKQGGRGVERSSPNQKVQGSIPCVVVRVKVSLKARYYLLQGHLWKCSSLVMKKLVIETTPVLQYEMSAISPPFSSGS